MENMLLIEDQCNLYQDQISFLQFVLGGEFPWFFQREKNGDETPFYFLVHTLMHRNEDNQSIAGTINSPYYDICIKIFKKFCEEHDVTVSTIYRAALNCTMYNPNLTTRIHTDHRFEHKNFILYINEFNDGQTCIFDREHNLIKQLEPGLHKAVIFSGEPHAHNFCLPNQRRVVLVITFE
jgi:hypothetical protein